MNNRTETNCRNCNRRIVRAALDSNYWSAPDAYGVARHTCTRTMAAHRPAA